MNHSDWRSWNIGAVLTLGKLYNISVQAVSHNISSEIVYVSWPLPPIPLKSKETNISIVEEMREFLAIDWSDFVPIQSEETGYYSTIEIEVR